MNYVKPENLKTPDWRATYILRPDLKLLEKTISDVGRIFYPLLVREEDSTIIDGHARWMAAQHLDIDVPVTYISCSTADAMILHIRMNRARGSIVAKDLSDLLNLLLDELDYDDEEIRLMLGMTIDEFEVLLDGSLVKRKKLKEHKYSKAWVPIETNRPTETIKIERPKTADR